MGGNVVDTFDISIAAPTPQPTASLQSTVAGLSAARAVFEQALADSMGSLGVDPGTQAGVQAIRSDFDDEMARIESDLHALLLSLSAQQRAALDALARANGLRELSCVGQGACAMGAPSSGLLGSGSSTAQLVSSLCRVKQAVNDVNMVASALGSALSSLSSMSVVLGPLAFAELKSISGAVTTIAAVAEALSGYLASLDGRIDLNATANTLLPGEQAQITGTLGLDLQVLCGELANNGLSRILEEIGTRIARTIMRHVTTPAIAGQLLTSWSDAQRQMFIDLVEQRVSAALNATMQITQIDSLLRAMAQQACDNAVAPTAIDFTNPVFELLGPSPAYGTLALPSVPGAPVIYTCDPALQAPQVISLACGMRTCSGLNNVNLLFGTLDISCAPCSIQGAWSFVETETFMGLGCADDFQGDAAYVATIVQSGNSITLFTSIGDFQGSVLGANVHFAGTRIDPLFDLPVSFDVNLVVGANCDSLSGVSTWHWTDPSDPLDICTGENNVSAQRL